jgi:adenylate cyclase
MPNQLSVEGEAAAGSLRIATIAFVDIVGSSILMAEDEAGTLARWMKLLREVIRPQAERFHARTVKSTGDGVLVEFPSAIDGIQWAREVQRAAQQSALAEPDPSSAILLRIALHRGSIVVIEGDIYGASVNLTSRLQEHAEPGGIVLTHAVHEELGDVVGVQPRDLGMIYLKSIDQPVHAYAFAPEVRIAPTLARPPPTHLPSIAVMPLQNLGGDPADDYFADGIVEDITVSLAGLHELRVIARTSTVTFKQRPADPRKIGQALGVRYVMTGSVRRSPRRLRVSVQLCDCESGDSLWGDASELPDDDLFDVQDRIVQRIVSGIAPNVRAEELRRAMRKQPENFTAYDYTLRALDVINTLNATTFAKAREYLEKAMSEDRTFAMPVAWAARWHSLNIGQGWSQQPQEDASRAIELATRAIELDRHNAVALATFGHLRSYLFHDYDAALMSFDRALAACPNSALAWVFSALTLSYVGRGEEAVRHAEQALRLSPVDQLLFYHYNAMAWSHFSLGHYEEAVRWARLSASENPKFTANLRILIAGLSALGDHTGAKRVSECLLRQNPNFSLGHYERTLQPFRDEKIKGRFMQYLRDSGLPG